MQVHRSNRLEVLARELARVVGTPVGGPLDVEPIVVQSRGMERWLSLELARRLGVCSGFRFPFPRAFVDEVIDAVLSPRDGPDPFARERLCFSVARRLQVIGSRPEFRPIDHYLKDDAGGHKLLDLAQRIAQAFDEYAVYRQPLLLAWERGEGTDWQAELWRDLVAELGATHLVCRTERFRRAWPRFAELPDGLPPRVCVFGISSLPPVFLEVLALLGRWVPVHLFWLCPSREHMAEIRSPREILQELRRTGVTSAADLHLTEGNPLLATWGRVPREFQQVLDAAVEYQELDVDLYVDPGTSTVLHALQSDVLHLRHRGAGRDSPPLALDTQDRSVTVHICHSQRREVEVLHDLLRALFEQDSTLAPHDVVVMAPDIEDYASHVDAVFATRRGDGPGMPYRIADRAARADNPVAQAVWSVIEVVRGRMTASGVVDLLHHEPVRRRFGIGTEEIRLVTRWVREAGVRWGVDAADRVRFGLPEARDNTWEFGLLRLLLGYAAPGARRELFAGVLPYDDVEGSSAELLGRLAELCVSLFELRDELGVDRPLRQWRDVFEQLFGVVLDVPVVAAGQLQVVREALAELADCAETAGFERPVSAEVVVRWLERRLDAERNVRQFLTGGITFCALLPMRSIPFRVVCLLGMNDERFPRMEHRPGFDRIVERHEPGDRSLRDEDRLLFLEALLSARERLLISYIGRSVHDNTTVPPSVVVGELLDAIDESFDPALVGGPQVALSFGGTRSSASSHIVVEHPLQRFSPRYFDGSDPRLFSYDAMAADGARQLLARANHSSRFLQAPLPLPAASAAAPQVVRLDELVDFFKNPARALLRRRLEIDLDEYAEDIPDREPRDLVGLAEWRVGQLLVNRALDGENPREAWAAIRAEGVLPTGTPGRCSFEDLVPQVEALVALGRAHVQGDELEPLDVAFDLGSSRVEGRLHQVWPTTWLTVQFAHVKAKNQLAAWLTHLVLHSLPGLDRGRRTVLVGRAQGGQGESFVFRPLEPGVARERLAELLDLYWLGQRVPLAMFPDASAAYARHLKGKEGEAREGARASALRRARDCYSPVRGDRQHGENQDPYVQLLFGDRDPLDPSFAVFEQPGTTEPPSFADLACRVFEPLAAALEVSE